MRQSPAEWPLKGGALRESPMRISGAANVRRWNGADRTTSSKWDGLRRVFPNRPDNCDDGAHIGQDPELWYASGDCFIHLHANGHSKRGPSFCVDSSILRQCRASFLLHSLVVAKSASDKSFEFASPRFLFIPAPPGSSKDEAFEWHLTTRNFFAFCHCLPIVGITLGQAVISLHRRLESWRPGDVDNTRDMVAYLDAVGYLSFPHCPDYALAMLQFAEYSQLEGLWRDAFAHAVGMSEMLPSSVDLAKVSASTAKLINQTASELNNHVRNTTSSLSSFLEEDLSPAHLGLTSTGRSYLFVLRDFLRRFYSRKFGYWPPPENSLFSKSLFRSMCSDFQMLYEYLVDRDSTNSLKHQKMASGGICVFQNIQAFNKRHGLNPLPHPLPRLPDPTPSHRLSQSQRALARWKLTPKSDEIGGKVALECAANSLGLTSHIPFIRAYRKFEIENAPVGDDKFSLSDARKVSWIVVYFMLQYLKSLLDPPDSVTRADEATYPLCSRAIAKVTAPWIKPAHCSLAEDLLLSPVSESSVDSGSKTQSASSSVVIAPDCQTDNYIEHMYVSVPSWRQTLVLREPSTVAFKELERSVHGPKKARGRSLIAAHFGPYLKRSGSVGASKSDTSSCDIRPQTSGTIKLSLSGEMEKKARRRFTMMS